ncbi:MAG: type II toxin-antitoxin system HicB family antitoxin [Oscillospiraceae bacterium]|jgi:predicted RNase H-like HicB family nuclease|nr:type II toxin-antitoxin system HicB family antitoxin [Oscillospiraceae bacterium]
MKTAYPVIFSKAEKGYTATVPDFPLDTHGKDLTDAIFMARDAIGLAGMSYEDRGDKPPSPSDIDAVPRGAHDIISLVDIDFAEYRRAYNSHAVRRNVSLPSWLNTEADRAGLNVSAILQTALKQELNRAK